MIITFIIGTLAFLGGKVRQPEFVQYTKLRCGECDGVSEYVQVSDVNEIRHCWICRKAHSEWIFISTEKRALESTC